ncbi:MAG: hypothetical protein FWF50_03285 [Defluviitaleaceae bacterium]|nr:hypothetical protein [Defluviitaleaceae bacterium]
MARTEDSMVMKFSLLIVNVEKRLVYGMDTENREALDFLSKGNSKLSLASTSPLRIIFPQYATNEYLKILVNEIHSVLPYGNEEAWHTACEIVGNLHNIEKRIQLAKNYLQMQNYKLYNARCFVFWAMVGCIAYKEEFAENISMAVDFARIFGLKEAEILDISMVVRAFFGEADENYRLVHPETAQLFNGAWNYLKTH